jgi:hypothetical protein
MEIELETILGNNVWTVIDQENDMNVLPLTWAFKCERFTDILV